MILPAPDEARRSARLQEQRLQRTGSPERN
jgi:hypothetical protein